MLSRQTMRRAALIDAMQDGAVVLTGNARLSRSLLAEHARCMQAAGREAWQTPKVLPWLAWLVATWDEACLLAAEPLDRLLAMEQEIQLWTGVIMANQPGLLRVGATARAAQRSWQLLHDWRIGLDEPAFHFHENTQAFRRWALAFRAACAERGLVSEAELAGRLTQLSETGGLALTGQLLLVGFYDLSPAQQGLAAALSAAGVEVAWVGLQTVRGEVRRVQARDPKHEMRLTARWARVVAEQQPEARIGIIVPDLGARRHALGRSLSESLDPPGQGPGAVFAGRPWNVSLGLPLDGYPVIQTALRLLSMTAGVTDIVTLGSLLTSPYWAMPADPDQHLAELARRALLDRRLRSRGDRQLSLGMLAYYANQEAEDGTARPWRTAALHRRLVTLEKLQRTLPGAARPAEWARCLAGWLAEAGWCVGCRLHSSDFQAAERWQRLLSAFSRLDEFSGRMKRADAVAALGRLASETIFQPGTADARVQVLGMHEANEQHFDYLWVMNLHDGLWPRAPAPDGFIPLELQRQRAMPGCDPDRELELARVITARLAGAADRVLLSYPASDGEETLAPSPVIMEFEVCQPEEIPVWRDTAWCERLVGSASMAPLQTSAPPGLAAGQATGGSGVLRSQAACPFRAFAEYRLAAWPLDSSSLGLGAMRRGSLLHRAMELLWRKLEGSARLLELDEEALRRQVEEAAQAALEEQRRRSPLVVSPRYGDIESRRLVGQLIDWLELERQRSPFRVVAFEQEALVEAGGLQLRVVMDRIDELEDGRQLIIDYKTGRVSPAGWFGERPDDPQLPLYALAHSGAELAGLAFAQLRGDGLKFTGVVSDGDVLPGLPLSRGPLAEAANRWPSVLADWSQAIAGLAAEFRAGRAEVAPKNGLHTCERTYCRLAPLCRVRAAVAGEADG
jgi:probable DNA repair protein